MREKNRLKTKSTAKKQIASLDGFIPQRPRFITTPDHVKKNTDLGKTPRRSLAGRRQLISAEDTLEAKRSREARPLIGNFDQEEIDSFKTAEEKENIQKPIRGARQRKSLAAEDAEKKKRKPNLLRRWWKNRSRKFKIMFVIAIVAIAGLGFLGYRIFGFVNSVFGRDVGNSNSAALNGDPKPEDLNTEGDGRLNLLLLGRGGEENDAPDLTDTIIVVSVDLKNKSTSLLSIPRDMYVDDLSDNGKINGAFSHAKQSAIYNDKDQDSAEDEGIKEAISAVRMIAGVPIHKYALTDYVAFRDVVNSLGGVDVDIPETLYDGYTGWYFKSGQQTLNGDRALEYARTRHGSERGDFDRTENQRRLLVGMRQKATSTGIIANPVKLNSLANAVQKNIRTDLTIDEAKTVFERLKDMSDASIKSLDLAQPDEPLVTTGNIGGQSFVYPTLGMQDYTKIRAYARTNMADPYILQESPSIAVYNGSNQSGLATLVGDVLSGYGYKVLEKETSKEIQTTTKVIKINKESQKPFTERFLSVRFGVTIGSEFPSNIIPDETLISTNSSNNPDSKPIPDYIIILGTDYNQKNDPTW